MEQQKHSICLNCFGKHDAHVGSATCPHCGYDSGAKPEQAYFIAPGTVLCERYIIGTPLGYGGFGVIYRVWDKLLDASAAIKEFYPIGFVSRTPGDMDVAVYPGERRRQFRAMLDRFLVEAKYMAKFNGEPNIVNVFDYFEANSTAYIVMEYLNGLSLKHYLEESGGRLPLDAALSIMKPVLMGLSKIHGSGILHRDISPENIVITADNQIKILDFGAARLGAASAPDDARNVVIKIGYAPPEQYRSHGEQGPFTDVYAAGATLYRMLTGATPDESVDREEADSLARPSRLGVDLPPNVDRAIMKALALQPSLRFQNMGDMIAALYRNKRIDYPEDELAKRRRHRAFSVASACFAVVAAMAVLAGYLLVYVPSHALDAARISPDSITAWVACGLSADDALCEALEAAAGQFCQDYPQFSVHVVRVQGDQYYSDLKRALSLAGEQGGEAGEQGGGTGEQGGMEPPDLFFNDRGEIEFMDSAIGLDKLLRQLDVDSYYFLGDYSSYYPLARVMPLGFDVGVVYANLALARDAGLDVPAAVESIAQFEAPPEFEAFSASETEASGAGAGETEANGAGAGGTEANGAGAGGTEADGAGADGTEADGAGADGTEANGAGAGETEADRAGAGGTEASGAGEAADGDAGGAGLWYVAADLPHLADALWLFGYLEINGSGAVVSGDGLALMEAIALTGARAPLGISLSSDPFAPFKDDRLAYLMADTSLYRFVQNSLLGYYGVVPLSSGGRMVGRFSGEFSVSSASTRNRQDLAMLFLQYALHENIQNVMNTQFRHAMPLHKGAFERFTSTYGDLDFFTARVPDVTVLSGQGRRAASERLASALIDRLFT